MIDKMLSTIPNDILSVVTMLKKETPSCVSY